MNYVAQLYKTFDQALSEIEKAAEKRAFRIQHIHHVSDILREKGFDIERYAIIELCNPKYAYSVLAKDKNYGSILPRRILLYEKEGKLFIASPRPAELVQKLGMNELNEISQEVDRIIKEIIIEVEK
jgi:uncharacterized protein (DUF302 family)